MVNFGGSNVLMNLELGKISDSRKNREIGESPRPLKSAVIVTSARGVTHLHLCENNNLKQWTARFKVINIV